MSRKVSMSAGRLACPQEGRHVSRKVFKSAGRLACQQEVCPVRRKVGLSAEGRHVSRKVGMSAVVSSDGLDQILLAYYAYLIAL